MNPYIPLKIVWGLYCVIFYVDHFLNPLFGYIYIQSLLYTPIFLVFNPNYFSTVCNHVLWCVWYANLRGGGGCMGSVYYFIRISVIFIDNSSSIFLSASIHFMLMLFPFYFEPFPYWYEIP